MSNDLLTHAESSLVAAAVCFVPDHSFSCYWSSEAWPRWSQHQLLCDLFYNLWTNYIDYDFYSGGFGSMPWSSWCLFFFFLTTWSSRHSQVTAPLIHMIWGGGRTDQIEQQIFLLLLLPHCPCLLLRHQMYHHLSLVFQLRFLASQIITDLFLLPPLPPRLHHDLLHDLHFIITITIIFFLFFYFFFFFLVWFSSWD